MKKYFFYTVAILFAMPVAAQETYENAPLAQEDLNGTARYVGMGGAMEALGADISTIGSNPAGIGLFRRSYISGSFGLVNQPEVSSFKNGNKTNVSFDQAGFVYALRTGRSSFINFGFNYHKSKNFNSILSAVGRLNGASQNKLSYLKGQEGVYGKDGVYYDKDNGAWISNSNAFSEVDYLYYNILLHQASENSDGTTSDKFFYNDANGYRFNRANTGYIGEYDFNISGNSNDRFYWGLTFGIHDVHYKGESTYTESLIDASGTGIGDVILDDNRKITGTGFDVKAGIIFRPVETSPFRIGLYVHTPTWYDLTTSNYTTLNNNSSVGEFDNGHIGESYDFHFYTPWKFGVSLGHTVGNYLALGATYEYADYSACDMRINDGGYYDYDGYYETTSRDTEMKDHIERTLKGVSTLKLGAEFKVAPGFAVRLGYNYVSPMYNKDGYKDGTLNSPGSYYSSSTDYTNWKTTNRITAGFGYSVNHWSFDAAYQYSQTDGDFYPFMSYVAGSDEDAALDNIPDAVKVSNKRHQLLFTIGYRF